MCCLNADLSKSSGTFPIIESKPIRILEYLKDLENQNLGLTNCLTGALVTTSRMENHLTNEDQQGAVSMIALGNASGGLESCSQCYTDNLEVVWQQDLASLD